MWGKIFKTNNFLSLDMGKCGDMKVYKRAGDGNVALFFWANSRKVVVLPDILEKYRICSSSWSKKLVSMDEIDELENMYHSMINHLVDIGMKTIEAQFISEWSVTNAVGGYINNMIAQGTDDETRKWFCKLLVQPIFTEVCAQIEPDLFKIIMYHIYLKAVKAKQWEIQETYIKDLAVYYCETNSVYMLFNAVYNKENVSQVGYNLIGELYPELKPGIIKRDAGYIELMHDKYAVKRYFEIHKFISPNLFVYDDLLKQLDVAKNSGNCILHDEIDRFISIFY